MILKKLQHYISSLANAVISTKVKQTYRATFKLAEINKTEDGEYIVTIQVINRGIFFNSKPEEILAKNTLVDQFSPRDIRTLTYLGYLGINSPKYKILAQRLSENNDKIIFAIKKKGEKKIIINTADEISNQKEIINNLNPNDAQIIGYTVASESILSEEKMKDIAYQQRQQENN